MLPAGGRLDDLLVAVFRSGRVVLTEFVLVVGHDVSAGLQIEGAEIGVRWRDIDFAAQRVEVVHGYILGPDIESIATGGHVGDLDNTIPGRNSEIRRAQGNDNRTHVRVNVAEDVGHTIAIKKDRSMSVRFIKAEIEALAVKQ